MFAGSCEGVTVARGPTLGLRAGALFTVCASTGYFRGLPGPRFAGAAFTCRLGPGLSGRTITLPGEFACSSLGAGEGKLGCGVEADREGGRDCNAAAAVIGVENWEVYGDS
jgi:hypothetical protein